MNPDPIKFVAIRGMGGGEREVMDKYKLSITK